MGPATRVGISAVVLISRSARTPVAALIAIGVLLGTFTTASADTRTKITTAQQQLRALEAQIASDRASLVALQASLRTSVVQVAESRRLYEAIQTQLLMSRSARARVQARYQTIRDQINKLAVGAYVGGPTGGGIQSLDPISITDASDAMQYVSSIVDHNAALAEEARQLGAELKVRATQEATVMAHRATALTQLQADQNALFQRFAEQQARLANLAQARAQVGTLLVKLRKQLRAEEIAAAELALMHGVTFGKWATAFLGAIGAPVARNNLVVIVAWETAEFTSAKWNPLATTYPMPGSTYYNSSGVRNYVSLQQGLEATKQTLSRPGLGYEPILLDLARNADPMDTARAINASRWCNGCADGQYVIELVPRVEQNYDSYANASAS
jgi:hypothetical protein